MVDIICYCFHHEQMYKKNSDGFERDVKRFMEKNGQPIRKAAFWQNKIIGLFDLFTAVYDCGGYEQVSHLLCHCFLYLSHCLM